MEGERERESVYARVIGVVAPTGRDDDFAIMNLTQSCQDSFPFR